MLRKTASVISSNPAGHRIAGFFSLRQSLFFSSALALLPLGQIYAGVAPAGAWGICLFCGVAPGGGWGLCPLRGWPPRGGWGLRPLRGGPRRGLGLCLFCRVAPAGL